MARVAGNVQQGDRRARRPKRSSAVVEQLAALKGNRDELDADEAQRRGLEDAALERYAAAVVRVQEINAERGRKAEALMAQVTKVHEQAKEAVADVEVEQAAALAALNQLGRSAEDIARMTGVPVKRVRSMLRAERPVPADGEVASKALTPVPVSSLSARPSGHPEPAGSGRAGK